ncbi:N-acetylneuraminate synthase family protein [Andreprevotia chitinilytica]|uniref:N-acetylneuraminate synthase family protein n=1 Tax=Andreprevotia chitinilytica TaxID=396808 RepID=UPI0005522F3F|nr:N-acetylneuraminate synthase family protein [Andreprevotia chitinilytica]
MTVQFGNRLVGDGQPCFITYEAGPTHDSLASAKRLVKLAAEAGADAVKFQIFDPDRLCADKKQTFSYEVLVDRTNGKTEAVEESLYELLCRRCLQEQEWRELKRYCDSLGLAFFSTVAFDEDISLLVELGCDSIKIASADVNHFPLIRKAARTGMCIQLDTGSATLGEVEAAVDVIRGEGNENIIIHQCPSGYPARLESINLNIITTLKRLFPYPVAFSDHTPGWEMDVAALALGANLLEKTITEDRTTRSVEHIFSLEPHEMNGFIRTIRDVEVALGGARRVMHAEELVKRQRVRRSVYLKAPAQAGQRLGDVAVEFRRPGHGIGPDVYEKLVDMKLRSNLDAGSLLKLDDLAQ